MLKNVRSVKNKFGLDRLISRRCTQFTKQHDTEEHKTIMRGDMNKKVSELLDLKHLNFTMFKNTDASLSFDIDIPYILSSFLRYSDFTKELDKNIKQNCDDNNNILSLNQLNEILDDELHRLEESIVISKSDLPTSHRFDNMMKEITQMIHDEQNRYKTSERKVDVNYDELKEQEKKLYDCINQDNNTTTSPTGRKKKVAGTLQYQARNVPVNQVKTMLESFWDTPTGTNIKKVQTFKTNINNYDSKKDLKFQYDELIRIELPQKIEAPKLEMNLDYVVKNPGIYTLDLIKKINNTKIGLFEKLPTPEVIEFENLDTYMKPSEDPNLRNLMNKNQYKYASSTSGISESLAHFFFKLSNFKSPHFYNLSEEYEKEPLKYMMFLRKPASIILQKNQLGCYTIDSNKIFSMQPEFILLKMGKYMEKLFTNTPEEFKRKYMKKSGNEEKILLKEDDYFNFVGYDKMLLRSQIDCQGVNSKGEKIVYEIKTRAVAPIRYDVYNYQSYLDYDIVKYFGKHSSYEREFYDLIRGAFMKYLFQLKIGGMDGAFISYHNTDKIFGFEYVSLSDIERRLLGNSNFSNVIFKASLKLMQEALDHILEHFSSHKDRFIITLFANNWRGTLDIFVELIDQNSYSDFQQLKPEAVVDYYYMTGYKPNVHKFSMIADPILNNVITTFTPVLFENNDNFTVRYQILYKGRPTFDEYMKIMHECFMERNDYNIVTEFCGNWKQAFDN